MLKANLKTDERATHPPRRDGVRGAAFLIATLFVTCSFDSLLAQTLHFECRWNSRFDTSTNQISPATGAAFYSVEMRAGGEIEIRRTNLNARFRGHANSEQFSATAEHTVDGYMVREFVAIDRRTGEIEAWTMMGEAGGSFSGQCRASTP